MTTPTDPAPELPEDRGAYLSPCRRWRYTLWRVWDPSRPSIAWIGLNPSTADEKDDDHTIRRCRAYSRALGAGGFYMLNLFAWRATDPRVLFSLARNSAGEDPIGEANDAALAHAARSCSRVIAAWGDWDNRDAARRVKIVTAIVEANGAALESLGVTARGAPRHPSRLPNGVTPTPWGPR
jgi:hypothetical protein